MRAHPLREPQPQPPSSPLGRWLWRALAATLLAPLLVAASPVSPVHAAVAQVASQIVISEIHYHPQAVGSTPEDFDDRENTEFIEILNLEPSAVDLGGWCLDDAISYCFDSGTSIGAGSTLVIAENANAFEQLYGFVPAAVYSGRLSNSGERVQLVANGVVQVDITWGTTGVWPVTADGGGPSLELVSAAGSLSSPANWASSTQTNGTPGSAPSLLNSPPPLVTNHAGPELVQANQAIALTASATGATAVNVVYRVDWGANQTRAMTPAGAGWQTTLPALSSGGFIEYRFEATGPGGVALSPRVDDAVDWWAVGVSSPQPHNVPVLDLFFSPQNWENIDNRACPCTGAVAYEGRIWTNVASRRAGFTSLNQPKAHLRLDFPPGHPFEASFLDGPADELTLDAGFPNYDIVREQLSWQLIEQAGFPAIKNTHVRVHQRGSLQGLYLLREEQDGNWRNRHDLDRGPFYKVEARNPSTFGFSGLWTKKERLDEPDTDIEALATCVQRSGDALRDCLLATTDVPQMINEFAAMVAVWQTDQREFNFFVYRDDTQNGLWRMLPDDLDRTWGNHTGNSLLSLDASTARVFGRCIGTDGPPANEICRAFMNVPEFKTMYLRRIRTLTDEVLDDPIWQARIANLRSQLAADWADDDAKWNRTSFSFNDIMDSLDGFVDDYIGHLRAGGHEGNIPSAQSPQPSIIVTDYQSSAGGRLGYALLSNPSSTESVDLSNWTFDGIAEIPEGLVILPGTTVAVSTDDRAFRAANPSFAGVRAQVSGTLAGQMDLLRRDGTVAVSVGEPAPPSTLVVNEYNAVSSSNFLGGGTAGDIANGSDPTFGRVAGNGGDWFEVIALETIDLRGWTFEIWHDVDGQLEQSAALRVRPNASELSAIAPGTIITISENNVDDLAFNPANNDWHLNLQANSAQAGSYFTGASQQNFAIDNDDTRIAIYDADGELVTLPTGEATAPNASVNSEEVFKLETTPSPQTLFDDPAYADGTTSTWGLPNQWNGGDSEQDLSALRGVPGDVDCSGTLNLGDALILAQFAVGGRIARTSCPIDRATEIHVTSADASGDGTIDLGDALIVAQCAVGTSNAFCPE